MAPILSPRFQWHGSATHADSRAFAERQQRRMILAAQERAERIAKKVKSQDRATQVARD